MKIITITPSPAVDLHLLAESFVAGEYNTARAVSRDIAGKGVNLSRALTASGIDNLAVVFLDPEDEGEFVGSLEAIGMRVLSIPISGGVRQNINIHHRGGETVISTDAPRVGAEHIRLAEGKLLPLVDSETYVVLSGSISSSSDTDAILSLLYSLKSRGASLIIDSRSLSLEEIVALRPHLIKPNEDEAEALSGIPVTGSLSAEGIACAIRDMGCEGVLLTLGGSGAVLADATGVYYTDAPRVEVRSTVGAGDSTIAGYLASVALGEVGRDRLCRAVAFGSAACIEVGTLPPRPEVIEQLLREMR